MAVINGTVVGAEAGFYPKEIEQSLRFEDGSSAYLSRTPASAGNRKTWTFSTWVKRGNLGVEQNVFGAGLVSGTYHYNRIYFDTSNRLNILMYPDTLQAVLYSKQVFRDVGAWYHIAVKWDTTQATASDRMQLYVNGELVTDHDSNPWGSTTYPSQNADGHINNNSYEHRIGQFVSGGANAYFDGYLAETHFTDGTAYDATAFGEFKNGVWVAKEFAGTYGTNGFYLDFADGGALGNDVSGNNNDWTATNLASTDVMLDSPTNNFATLNPLWMGEPTVPHQEGNLKGTFDSNGSESPATFAISSGKWYWEGYVSSSFAALGIIPTNVTPSTSSFSNGYHYYGGTGLFYTGVSGVAYGATYTTGDVIGVALNLDTNEIEFFKNGVSQGVKSITNNTYYPDLAAASTSSDVINFGQDSSFAGNKVAQGNVDANGRGDFYYAPPAGYLALCTANLPEPAIRNPQEHMNTVLWTGSGSTQSITGVGFQPDLIWTKSRSNAYSHLLYDAVRGATIGSTDTALFSNSTDAENTYGILYHNLASFDADGFTTGLSTSTDVFNTSGLSQVSWNWKANGSGVSNTDGSITSTVSANVDAGFSIVSYTGTGANATVGHGLSQAPDMIIVKNRSRSEAWGVYHKDIGATKAINLELTVAAYTYAIAWNNTAPTTSTFSLGTWLAVNGSSDQQIALCWHGVEGFSKFGSYTGNGSTDGPFIFTNFRPAFVMVKRTDAANSWYVHDSKRDNYNPSDTYLNPDLSNAEYSAGSGFYFDMLSNGFKIITNSVAYNASGGSYIYMAFAEMPAKYSLSR